MSGKDRYSVPFFFDGNLDSVIDCLPGCENGPGGKSEPVTVKGHMLRKFKETYGIDDTESWFGNVYLSLVSIRPKVRPPSEELF